MRLVKIVVFVLGIMGWLEGVAPVAQAVETGEPEMKRDPETLIFAVHPWKAPDELKKEHAPLVSYLGKELGKKTILHVAKDYQQIVKRIETKAIDVGFLSANVYVQAKKEIPALRYLVTANIRTRTGPHQPYYLAGIYTLKSSPFQSLQDFKGRRFAFTDPQSTSGYLYPLAFLKKRGVDPNAYFSQVFMLRKHDKIFAALASGSIDAGASIVPLEDEAIRVHGDIFKMVEEVAKIPGVAYVTAPHVSEMEAQALTQAFLKLTPESPAMREIQAGQDTYYKGFTVLGDSFYDVVREVEP